MEYYELMYIIDPVMDDDAFGEIVSKYTSFLEDNGAEIDEVDEWGSKKFAYEIDKKNSGYYVVVYFSAPGELIQKLERTMSIDDQIMRQMVLKYDAKMLRHRELKKKGEAPSILQLDEEEEES